MRRFANVKQALLISALVLVATSVASADQFLIEPHFECGLYTFRGRVKLRRDGFFALLVQHETNSPYELLLIGGSFDEKIKMNNLEKTVQVEIRKSILSNAHPVVFYRGRKNEPKVKYFRQIRTQKCKNS